MPIPPGRLARVRVENPVSDVVDYLRVDVSWLLVVGRARRACAVDELMVCLRISVDRHMRSAGECFGPAIEVIRDGDLVVAFALQEEDRLGKGSSDGEFVIGAQVEEVGGARRDTGQTRGNRV